MMGSKETSGGDMASESSPSRTFDNEEIHEHYLEHSTSFTELPAPEHAPGADLPPMPNLKKYQNPMTWSQSRKYYTTALGCVTTLITAYTPGAYSAGVRDYQADWHISLVAAYTGVSIFTTFFAIAPMILAPFSEIQGRRPVFVPAGIVYVISQVGSGVTRSFAGMLVTRALAGISGSVFSTMVSGVLADIFTAEHRNTPMTLFAGSTMGGTGLGPLISGTIVQFLDWRWIYYLQIITCGLTILVLIFTFKETRGSIILSRKASALNKWYAAIESATGAAHHTTLHLETGKESKPQRIRWKVHADEERASVATMMKISLIRPFHLLVTESVVFWFSLWLSFAWAVLYMNFAALPLIFTTSYQFNDVQNAGVFGAIIVAALLSTALGIWQGRIARRSKHFPDSPEGRLYWTCLQSLLLPAGLFWLGWTCTPGMHWIVPVIAVGCVTMGIFSVYLAVFNYFSDVYHVYASSANAAQSFCRNMFAGAIPLFVRQMYMAMGFKAASGLLGGVAVVLTGVPWVLVAYGERIRARSKIAKSLVGSEAR